MNEHNNNDGQMEETMTDAKNPWNADLNDPYLGLKLASERLSIVRYVFLVQIEDGIASAAQRASLEYADAVLIGWPETDASDKIDPDNASPTADSIGRETADADQEQKNEDAS